MSYLPLAKTVDITNQVPTQPNNGTPSLRDNINDNLPNNRKHGPKDAPSMFDLRSLYKARTSLFSEDPPTPSMSHLRPASPVSSTGYHDDEKRYSPWDTITRSEETWVPLQMRPWYWMPFVSIMVVIAIALEVGLHFSNKNQGWPAGDMSSRNIMHYVYTLLPVIVAAVLAGMWGSTDTEIKKMQPYVDLARGDSPPHRSLLLDYTRANPFLVWFEAASNRHSLTAVASLLVLLSLSFQPLAATIFVVRDTWIQVPDVTTKSIQAIGLNDNTHYKDLTSFLTAAGYASASVLYNLRDPLFTSGAYTIARFRLPMDITMNGTVFANTTAIKSETNCQPVTVVVQNQTDGLGWNNSASLNGCSGRWLVDENATTLFGTDVLNCSSNQPLQFGPVVFWFFDYEPEIMTSATFCYPNISLWDVNVAVDLASKNVTSITELQPFTSHSKFSNFSGNITGPPLNGRAFNGVYLNVTRNNNGFVTERKDAIQLQLPAAVYQFAEQSKEGIIGSHQNNNFFLWSDQIYTLYLTLVAKTVYFVDVEEPLTVQLKTYKQRVWLNDLPVHLLSAVLLLLAIAGTAVHIFHRSDRHNLGLRHESGTIASALSIGARTGTGDLLAGVQSSKDISHALEGKKFGIQPDTKKIVIESGEEHGRISSPQSL